MTEKKIRDVMPGYGRELVMPATQAPSEDVISAVERHCDRARTCHIKQKFRAMTPLASHVERTTVPGGWIYTNVDIPRSVYVPDPEHWAKAIADAIARAQP